MDLGSFDVVSDKQFSKIINESILVDNFTIYRHRETGDVYLKLSQSGSDKTPALVSMANLFKSFQVLQAALLIKDKYQKN